MSDSGQDDDWDFEDDEDDSIDLEADMEKAGVAAAGGLALAAHHESIPGISYGAATGSGASSGAGSSSLASKLDANDAIPTPVSLDELANIRLSMVSELSSQCSVTRGAADRVLQEVGWDADMATSTLGTVEGQEQLQRKLHMTFIEPVFNEQGTEAAAGTAAGTTSASGVPLSGELTRTDSAGARHRSSFPADAAARGELMCEICFNMLETEAAAYAMACGHWFCRDCYGAHVQTCLGVLAASMTTTPTCPQHGCTEPLAYQQYSDFLTPKDLQVCRSILARRFERGNQLVTECPNRECELRSYWPAAGTRRNVGVRCTCGREYCFGCHKVFHAPMRCAHFQLWKLRVKVYETSVGYDTSIGDAAKMLTTGEFKWRDSQADRTVLSMHNTKKCPWRGCGAICTKISGCDFVTCAMCGTSFDWSTLDIYGDGTDRGFNTDDKAPDAFAELSSPTDMVESEERIRWYGKRFAIHRDNFDESVRAMPKQYKAAVAKLLGPRVSDQINSMLATIKAARRAMCWSFAHSYFLAEGSVDQLRFRATMSVTLEMIQRLQVQVHLQQTPESLAARFGDPDQSRKIQDLHGALLRSYEQLQAYENEDEDSLADAKVVSEVIAKLESRTLPRASSSQAIGRGAAKAGAAEVSMATGYADSMVGAIGAAGRESYLEPWIAGAGGGAIAGSGYQGAAGGQPAGRKLHGRPG